MLKYFKDRDIKFYISNISFLLFVIYYEC